MIKIKKKIKIALVVFLALIVIAGIGCGFYLHDYYHADPSAMEILETEHTGVFIEETANDRIVFRPEQPSAGLIFYPGGKVQYEAYAPLMEALAERNILCILLHMPGNLAVLDMNAADGVIADYPEISRWYIGGHSLGGSMAAAYVSKHTQEYEGLILLASYSTTDLGQSDLEVLSVYGSEDGVMNRDSYAENARKLPVNCREVVIQGGCHAYFGDYGPQDGDGTPAITREEQIQQTVSAITDLMSGGKCLEEPHVF